ncbi:cyclin-dependent kinase 2 [Cyclospora cayetanensis]|uniref:Cyclin-dependent kinase 2 homolog n=1 Tax=Cyclospora cayetanensis TaxID=88456 RepID=A0A6P6RR96_9EIME|nr:cyclin-dependent kinase 2 [Cyclospora cayetanensis]
MTKEEPDSAAVTAAASAETAFIRGGSATSETAADSTAVSLSASTPATSTSVSAGSAAQALRAAAAPASGATAFATADLPQQAPAPAKRCKTEAGDVAVAPCDQEQQEPPQQPNGRTAGGGRYLLADTFLGEGTYGRVERAWDVVLKQHVAIKRVNSAVINSSAGSSSNNKQLLRQCVGQVGLHFTTIRELKVMRELQPPKGHLYPQQEEEEQQHLMGLLDVFTEHGCICLVMEEMRGDLRRILDSKTRLSEAHIKCIVLQLLQALHRLHKHYLLHRDISPANIFVAEGGICKLADFGLSRAFGAVRELMTAKVVTLWYRAPELLWGADRYGDKADTWSVGCILYELLTGRALFPGANDVDQLCRIFSLLGTPQAAPPPSPAHAPSVAAGTLRPPAERGYEGLNK